MSNTILDIKNRLKEQYKATTPTSSDFLNHAKTYWRTAFKLQGRCLYCGDKDNIEMHHINHVRKYPKTARQGFEKVMSLLNRKSIPLCKFHHNLVHSGKYDDIALSELFDTRVATAENFLKLK
ncbi:HNH endonuclease [Agrobacterium sp.]|uniref:HNH endonuclease n=1 Tax=Agrobacterium sp. TaxID=361 RepID=UPI00403465EF